MTKAELLVGNLMLKGKSNKQIATEIGITEKTVKFHATNIFKECGVKTRYEYMAKIMKESVTEDDVNMFKKIVFGE